MSDTRLWIKICGLRTPEAIAAAVSAGADAVGFVFHAASPRNVGIDEAARLAAAVPAGVEKVAVFLRPSQQLVDAVTAELHPDWVQTDAGDFGALRLPASQRRLPVLRTGQALSQVPLESFAPAPRFLVESGRSGAGVLADWPLAAQWSGRGEMVLAGGLDPANVAAAITAVRPFGVDVSSGVERGRGLKDPGLIHDFVRAARAAEARLAGPAGGVMQR